MTNLTDNHELRARFVRLLGYLHVPPNSGTKLWKDVSAAYSHPSRFYHGLDHIRQCVSWFEECKELPTDAITVELALWFHDVVYVPGSDDNEERSAQYAQSRLAPFLSVRRMDKLIALILATRHLEESDEVDVQLICDIDLTPLAVEREALVKQEKSLREEYSAYSAQDFYAGRLEGLEKLLHRKRIYQTDFFNGKYEERARANLNYLISLIRQLQAE